MKPNHVRRTFQMIREVKKGFQALAAGATRDSGGRHGLAEPHRPRRATLTSTYEIRIQRAPTRRGLQ
jgi:hypothetical protein